MKLYWGPHTCAIGTHILLEEIGKPYETEKIDVQGGQTHSPEFLAINPKGKVPVLVRDDGSVLTEFGAIAKWLAIVNPESHLVSRDADEDVRASAIMDYVVGTIHGQGFGRIFLSERFEPQDPVHQTLGLGTGSVKKQGRKMVEEGFAILDRQLDGRSYAAGDKFGIADATLFYVERWAPQVDIELPANLQAHYALVRERPAVQRVLNTWGEK
ncbi:glutathione S-transferase family protein [Aureimonas psammosilenae]|uniref:glutathione S-transferase family protein n=1 Tax=Aureimonas psammosilenae TaxID=2495496 RepID=UPI001260CC67|nr:glutathione S-transferase N-terminal domain-containing protein [Aureimonas psammosilenae]